MFNVDQVLYINLDRSTDRRASIEGVIDRLGLKNKSTRVPGYVPRLEEIPAGFSISNGRRRARRIGNFGCAMSHLNCYKLIKENNWNSTLIFEDDAHLCDGWEKSIEEINCFLSKNNWDIFYPFTYQKEFLEVAGNIVKIHGQRLAHGYVVNLKIIDKLIERCDPRIERSRAGNTGGGIIDRVLEKECPDFSVWAWNGHILRQGQFKTEML